MPWLVLVNVLTMMSYFPLLSLHTCTHIHELGWETMVGFCPCAHEGPALYTSGVQEKSAPQVGVG